MHPHYPTAKENSRGEARLCYSNVVPMGESFIGFYDLDAAPSRGLTGELATRLGTATEAPGFIDGSFYVRSDTGAVAIVIQYDGGENWVNEGPPGMLLYAVDWRSRNADARHYRHAGEVSGGGDALTDSSFYVVQRFETRPEAQDSLVKSLLAYTERFAQPIHGFLRGDAYASIDGTRVVFIMPWAHEAALNALENATGSLEAMQTHLRLAERHTYESFDRVSYLRASANEVEASTARSEAAARRTPV